MVIFKINSCDKFESVDQKVFKFCVLGCMIWNTKYFQLEYSITL